LIVKEGAALDNSLEGFMRHGIGTRRNRSRGAARGMRTFGWALAVTGLAGCQPPASPGPAAPAIVEPAAFATWPSVTEQPVRVSRALWMLCVAATPEQIRAAEANPHASRSVYSIVVRVSPDGATAFRDGRPLPVGAVVVKEKHDDRTASGPLQGYAAMTKREAGFDPAGGDWEYAFVALSPERKVTRGRMPECAGCHASARDTDYLFRSYPDPSADPE
jgi:hypothetical protein